MPTREADVDYVGAYKFKVEIDGASAAGDEQHYYTITLENGTIAGTRTERLADSFEFSALAFKGEDQPTDPILVTDIPEPTPQPAVDRLPDEDGFQFTDKGAQSDLQPTDPIIIADIPEPTPQLVEPDVSQQDDRWAYHEADGRDEWIDIAS